jgi:type VI secretion system secreted protein Hcp
LATGSDECWNPNPPKCGEAGVPGALNREEVDKSSPLLARACATGQHFPQAVLTVCRPGPSLSFDLLKITLSDVTIPSYSGTGGEEG